MTDPDPTLAALLDNPHPDARLIAADRAEELGDELISLTLRYLDLMDRVRLSDAWIYGLPSGDGFHVLRATEGRLACVQIQREGHHHGRSSRGWPHFRFFVDGRWELYRLRQRDWVSAAPPPGLEAAVLAVLRARLAEVRQG
jgi:hypothetical protein